MSDDNFLDRLKDDARRLRYEPDDIAVGRLSARIRERIAARPTATHFLARWFRPVAASLTAVALAAMIGIAWIESAANEPAIDAIAASSGVEIAVGGDFYSVGE